MKKEGNEIDLERNICLAENSKMNLIHRILRVSSTETEVFMLMF